MTDKLHCPFCSEEIFVAHETMCVCKNDKCRAWGCAYPKFILTALIDGKKAQDTLNRAISEITDLCTTILYCSGEADNEIQMIQMRDEMVKEAKARIFGKITSITKQGE